MNKIGIITSGGDSPGMNTIIQSIVNYTYKKKIKCIGIKNGFNGLIKKKFFNLSKKILIKNINGLGGTILGAGRSKLFFSIKGRQTAYYNIKNKKINGLIVIGGNGTFTGIKKFVKEYKNIPIIGIPGTIDNDIYGTDHTIGYDTTLNNIIKIVKKIQDTAQSNKRIFIVEVMGKNTGFLALNSGITIGALYIFFKKLNLKNLKKIIEYIKKNLNKHKIIIVAENKKIGQASKDIYNILKKKKIKLKIRCIILGHIQRGGSPTFLDRMLAIRLGINSIKTLINKKKNKIIGIKNNKINYIPLSKI
ncbi:MAG: 6-phosphofructokinase, partial [Candidatus Shikimatogenerans sp. JK-2022]|nr:6-phosphofructokinase [Candidatus Shikimatogenerans bostrichidophilus]